MYTTYLKLKSIYGVYINLIIVWYKDGDDAVHAIVWCV